MATSTYEASYKKYFGDRFDNITKNSSDEEVRNLYDKWAADYDKVSIISLRYNHDKNSWDNWLTFLTPPPSGEVKRIGRYCIKVALWVFFVWFYLWGMILQNTDLNVQSQWLCFLHVPFRKHPEQAWASTSLWPNAWTPLRSKSFLKLRKISLKSSMLELGQA